MRVALSSLGGEILSVKGKDGTEYLWQGDPAYWKKRAPMLFPVCGRLTDGECTLEGETCKMDTHGFFRWTEMDLAEKSDNMLAFRLSTDETTRRQYPREWTVNLRFTLTGNTLDIHFYVQNKDAKNLYFGYGGHPGFRVPLKEGLQFDDYLLKFSEKCEPLSVGMSDDCFVQGPDTPFPLHNGSELPLKHRLFDRDAIYLRGAAHKVTLCSPLDGHSVTLEYPQFPFLGIWHTPKSDAPFVCVEPLTSLPSRQNIVEALEKKDDMICLALGRVYQNNWNITFD